MQIIELNNYIKSILDPNNISDYALNGIQIGNTDEIKKIGFAVDASFDTINQAVINKCNLLIVHHGFFWSKVIPIIGSFREKVKMLLDNNVGLIAYHLPLDSHEEYGNNIQILKAIGYDKCEMFANYKGIKIGWFCENINPVSIDEIYSKLNIGENLVRYLDFGKKEIKTIGVVSGGGNFAFDEIINNRFDLFITGDSEHIIYHTAKENKINVLFAGHYFTETFGVKALKKLIEKELKIQTVFFDVPTGL